MRALLYKKRERRKNKNFSLSLSNKDQNIYIFSPKNFSPNAFEARCPLTSCFLNWISLHFFLFLCLWRFVSLFIQAAITIPSSLISCSCHLVLAKRFRLISENHATVRELLLFLLVYEERIKTHFSSAFWGDPFFSLSIISASVLLIVRTWVVRGGPMLHNRWRKKNCNCLFFFLTSSLKKF